MLAFPHLFWFFFVRVFFFLLGGGGGSGGGGGGRGEGIHTHKKNLTGTLWRGD